MGKTPAGKGAKTYYEVLFVRWIDSCEAANGWHQIDDIKFDVNLECQTIGFLLDDRKDRITLAGSVGLNAEGDGAETADLGITIPKSAIIEMKKVKI
jgi:hypothetical protein